MSLIPLDKLQNNATIDEPQYSQPLSTAIQIALIELLKAFGIRPDVVVGHSSGEIAAAYVNHYTTRIAWIINISKIGMQSARSHLNRPAKYHTTEVSFLVSSKQAANLQLCYPQISRLVKLKTI